MSFFVTSVAKGDGANYGGLAGADAHCQMLAAAAGRGGAKWVAYLSTQGPGAVNARDRIGNGPWYNARGQMIAMNVAELHGDTLEVARLGNRINKTGRDEKSGVLIKGSAICPTSTTFSPGHSQTVARSRLARTAPATTTRATARVRSSLAITIGWAAQTRRGTPCIRAKAAASRI